MRLLGIVLAVALACVKSGQESHEPANITCVNRTRAANIPLPPGCSTTVSASTLPADQVQALGTIQVGTTVAFEVPPGTESVTIVQQVVSAPPFISFQPLCTQSAFNLDNTTVPLRVTDPGGQVWYDDHPPAPITDGTTVLTFFASDSPGTGTLTIPNTSKGFAATQGSGLPPGTWSLLVSDYAYECALGKIPDGALCSMGTTESTYDVNVVTKAIALAAAPDPALDLTLYLATTATASPDRPLPSTAAEAVADPDLQRMLETLRTMLAGAGIRLGTVTFRADLPESVLNEVSGGVDVDGAAGCAPLSLLLQQAVVGDALNVFLVSGFIAGTAKGATSVIGIDGTIPGPPSFGGTTASGVAVSSADLRFESQPGNCALDAPVDFHHCGDDLTAYIVAHEAGHYMGLYHVVESTGAVFDPLDDTPTCFCRSCAPPAARLRCIDAQAPPANNFYQVTTADCTRGPGCGGGDNLMFWLFGAGSAGTVTPEQVHVMRTSPLLH
jgi:hypothetical protein